MNKVLASAVCCLLLSTGACATNTGSQSVNDFARYQQIQNGETTKVQVGRIFGQPAQIREVAETGESIWSYFQVTSRMNPSTFIPFVGMVTGGNDLDITQADFYFDRQEVLIRSQREQRSRYVNQWLGMADAMTRSGQVEKVKAEMERLGLPFDAREASLVAGWADAAE
jgi:hypothetical protein